MKSAATYLLIFLSATLFFSCEESRKQAAEKLNELNEHAEQINNTLDQGIKKIEALDSVIGEEVEQIKGIDSLIQKTSTKIDSIATKKSEVWENLTN